MKTLSYTASYNENTDYWLKQVHFVAGLTQHYIMKTLTTAIIQID